MRQSSKLSVLVLGLALFCLLCSTQAYHVISVFDPPSIPVGGACSDTYKVSEFGPLELNVCTNFTSAATGLDFSLKLVTANSTTLEFGYYNATVDHCTNELVYNFQYTAPCENTPSDAPLDFASKTVNWTVSDIAPTVPFAPFTPPTAPAPQAAPTAAPTAPQAPAPSAPAAPEAAPTETPQTSQPVASVTPPTANSPDLIPDTPSTAPTTIASSAAIILAGLAVLAVM